ncbi:nucleotidyl transferase AbiEii/AbiGii toxin family protein [Tepidanaerobacter acetatoxydans]|jgi:predicted nucleotidyltransferase component of viral defense system|uniref:nucleotidyl transferase AbiEii/AbiGii toxin family protein n=1 Tax=Tepidanaerobacter acetatoxydans TaxID=499229 RepID=UPI00350E38C1
MIYLFEVDRKYYLRLSEKTGFHKDVIEKVHRLITILEFINENAFLRDRLVLKGGTALNLTVFNLPRLSVDIDLDFHSYDSRDIVLEERGKVRELLHEYLKRRGYEISKKSKDYFALESIVARFQNNSGNYDNIKVEINYSLRHHIWKPVMRKINTELFGPRGEIKTLNGIELLASKTAALYNRLAARDFYDLYNVKRFGIVSEDEYDDYCKAVVFYGSISGEAAKLDFSPARVDELKKKTVYQDLYPMLVKGQRLELDYAKSEVKEFLTNSISITPRHKEYLQQFAKGNYRPELLFSGEKLENIKGHPTAIWKTMNTSKKK